MTTPLPKLTSASRCASTSPKSRPAALRPAGHLLISSSTPTTSPRPPANFSRWNDGRFVKLHRPDETFLQELLTGLNDQLSNLSNVPQIIAAVHHLPFRQLLPPSHNAQWDFAKAFLGSQKIGDLLLEYPNVTHALCGHSHFPATAQINHIQAINIGSGYRQKTYKTLDLPD